ncbi:uncharacterized protein FA14DRAFT_181065 [Meira miltonrushii]|uniref:Mitotic-spindle organizing protein 1 n=1 Tax=Meira miltonrushii TaxID=1280837 RepID=A0A316VG36_9BASI|nr:uncharacterized protein FA14DRAFT_181065 [Meira miltonrushii]PWN34445.1 hypothetical protein FA14DRAFT_181065 [Meira miltonrushii]
MERASESGQQQSMELLHELSQLMQTGLSREQLRICIDLIQTGEDPKAIAIAIKELRHREATSNRQAI